MEALPLLHPAPSVLRLCKVCALREKSRFHVISTNVVLICTDVHVSVLLSIMIWSCPRLDLFRLLSLPVHLAVTTKYVYHIHTSSYVSVVILILSPSVYICPLVTAKYPG